MSQLSVFSSIPSSQNSLAERLNTSQNIASREEATVQQENKHVLSAHSEQGVQVTLRDYRSNQATLSSSSGVQVYQAAPEQVDAQPYASNILNAISAQLARDFSDGAGTQELQSRLEAGLSGFLDGFGQAFDELEQAGLLSDDIQADIEQTRDQVLSGLVVLAQEHNLSSDKILQEQENIVQSTGELSDSVQDLGSVLARQVSGVQAQLRDFSFSLKTADGDTVEVRASAYDVSAFYADSQSNLNFQTEQGSGFSLNVQGELDEQELVAINDLLSQVGQLTDTFFNGDIYDAFEEALSVGFDSSEITQFALNLTRTDIQNVSATYKDVANDFERNDTQSLQQRLAPLGDFARGVQQAGLVADLLGQDRELVSQLVEKMSDVFFAEQDGAEQARGFTSTLLAITS